MLKQSPPAQHDPFHASMLAAQAAVAKQDFISAEQSFRQALTYQKKSPPALAGLGQILCLLNRVGDGVPLLFQAGTLLAAQLKSGENCKQLLDLAYQLLNRHAPQEALKLAKSALRIDPRSANAFHIASLCLQSLNRHKEAYAHSLRAVELAPQEASAFIQLGVLEAKLGMPEQARQHLEYAVCKAPQAEAARAHRELGILLDKTGDYSAAFQHISQSGKMMLESSAVRNLDTQTVFRDIAGLKSAFDSEFLSGATIRQPKDELPTPVFLVGFYRSGTTLAEQILAAHPKLTNSDEAFLLNPVLHELALLTDSRQSLAKRLKSLDQAALQHLRQLYWQAATDILGPEACRKVLVDKTSMNILNLELINALFPDALLLFALRDPRDVCLSCFMQPFGLSALTANFLTWDGTARFYGLIMDYWLSIRNNLSMPILELRYEQVISDPKGVFQPIFAAMGLDWSEECNSFYQHAREKVISTPSFDQVTQPLYQSSSGRWRNYPEQIAEIHPLLKPYIQAYGYESTKLL
jgi:Tfp pilus assembly protein PilF